MASEVTQVQILVLDFGSQYTQLIARRLREVGVYTEIVPYFEKPESIRTKNPKGIILSGGPASVYEKDAYKPDSEIFSLGIPILGICYGMQYIAHFFGGEVVRAEAQEFGKAVLEIGKDSNALFAGVKQESIVWMSHADKVQKVPQGFVELAKSGNTQNCAIADFTRHIYALQFHPEVVHSECGAEILRNFAVGICGANTTWNMKNFAQQEIERLRAIVGQGGDFISKSEAYREFGEAKSIERLTQIWEDGAKATHKNLSQREIAEMRVEIQEGIQKTEQILIAQKHGKWLGFIAVEGSEIAMLFVAPQHFKKGIGRALLKEAFVRYLSAFEVINVGSIEWALSFYKHLGFKENGKTIKHYGGAAPELIALSIACEDLQNNLGLQKVVVNRCDWASAKKEEDKALYEAYHDREWGVELHDDKKLFEFLVLEGFQAGLSWITILKKREAFREAFDDFDYHKIATYDEAKTESLLQDAGIIRNRAKIQAAITNAQAFLRVQKEFGSFDKYIWGFVDNKPINNAFESVTELPVTSALSDKISKDLQQRGFKFVGSTTIYAFMQAVGMVNDHLTSCFKRNSSLGMQCDKILDFSQGTDAKSANLTKNPKNLHSHTANTRIVECQDSKHILAQNATSSKVLCAVSGGVDSSVVATLLYRAIGENLIPIFVDTGLLRKGEREAVEKMFRENLKVPLITADASALFLSRLKGVIDPEIKRKIIGETFIEVFEKEAKKHNANGEIKFLAQGTLYPDVIESVSVKGPSKVIKSHHNVGGLPEWMQFELIEPLRELFKDEVRALGRELGMPESMLMRHPFPGPGLAIRIMGEVNKADLDLLREADSIFIDELRNQGYYDKVWQAFCVLLNVRSVGVMGDNRTYDNTICVRAVEALDGMTATFSHLPHEFLESVSNRIINEVEGINRVVYDITSKPPGTIEWE